MQRFLWICLAGALGTGTRYLIGLWANEKLGNAFPYGTLIVNVTGCFLIALVMQFAAMRAAFPETLRLALTTGFLGGLTTYSAFNYESTRLMSTQSYANAAMNVGVTLLACFAAGLLGTWAATRLA